MSTQSAVHFDTPMRVHVALCVKDVAASLPFYRLLFGIEPTKVKPDYAKFEVASPPVNLTLNQVAAPVPHHSDQHFGIQVKSTDAVNEAIERFSAQGHATLVEERTTCCYAVQDKVWVADPDGHRWEIFVVTEAESEIHTIPTEATEGTACCAPEKQAAEPATDVACCTPKAEPGQTVAPNACC